MREAQLVSLFQKFAIQHYGISTDVYKVYSCGYTKVGQPDLIFGYPGNVRSYFIEVKAATSLSAAIAALRPAQIARHKEIAKSGQLVVLLYDGGCALMSKGYIWMEYPGQFDGFIHLELETRYDPIGI